MRVFNLNALHGDIDLHLTHIWSTRKPTPQEEIYAGWLKKAWVKHFMKSEEGFLHFVQVRKLPSFFKTATAATPKLEVSIPMLGDMTLEPETEWDLKDAEAGTLLYYSPGRHSLAKFANEVNDVRDYVYDLIDKDPKADLSKRAFPDMKRASEVWHAEQQRALQARLEAEAALRNAMESARAKPSWDHLERGFDWDLAVNEPFELNGQKFLLLRLTSQMALDYESYLMEHCVHSYGRRILERDPVCVILAVRSLDSAHLPLVTAELSIGQNGSNPFFIQIRGKHNHDAEQTIHGITKQLGLLVPQLNVTATKPLTGDISYRFRHGA